MTRREALNQAARRLAEGGIESPRLEAGMILSHIYGMERYALYLEPDREMGRLFRRRYDRLIGRRLRGAPVHYLIRRKEFMGLPFYVDRRVLIPRFDTEVLAETVLAWLRENPERRALADIGTGSGALAVSLAVLIHDLWVTAVDRSRAALAVARRNARDYGVDNRITFVHGDLLSPVPEADAIVSNPPYIRRGELPDTGEPRRALDGGPDGLHFYRRLAAESPWVLSGGGFIALEVGYDQADDVMELLGKTGQFASINARMDLAGIRRVVTAVRK